MKIETIKELEEAFKSRKRISIACWKSELGYNTKRHYLRTTDFDTGMAWIMKSELNSIVFSIIKSEEEVIVNSKIIGEVIFRNEFCTIFDCNEYNCFYRYDEIFETFSKVSTFFNEKGELTLKVNF